MIVRYHLTPAIGHIMLHDLRPAHLQHLYNEKRNAGLSARTVRYVHGVIHAALEQAMKNQLVVRNVSEATTRPSEGKRAIQPLTLDQVNQLLGAIEQDRLFPAVLLELGTGLRRGELLGLGWRNVDLQAGLPHIRFHDLRHSFATLMLELGEHPKTVQTMLRNSRIAITLDIYSHVSLDLEKQAAARLNAVLRERKALVEGGFA